MNKEIIELEGKLALARKNLASEEKRIASEKAKILKDEQDKKKKVILAKFENSSWHPLTDSFVPVLDDLYEISEKSYDDEWKYVLGNKDYYPCPFELPNGWSVIRHFLFEPDNEYQGETWIILKFSKEGQSDIFMKANGWWSSCDGTEIEWSSLKEAEYKPVQVMQWVNK